MAKTFQEWVKEGESLYDGALAEYRSLEAELAQIEKQIAGKRGEVDQIAKVLGKPLLEPGTRPAAADGAAPGAGASEVVDPAAPNATPYTRNSIARALAGQPLRR